MISELNRFFSIQSFTGRIVDIPPASPRKIINQFAYASFQKKIDDVLFLKPGKTARIGDFFQDENRNDADLSIIGIAKVGKQWTWLVSAAGKIPAKLNGYNGEYKYTDGDALSLAWIVAESVRNAV